MNKLVVDSREQLPLPLRSTDNYVVVTDKLHFGDYGLLIDEKLVCAFERKSALDLYSTLTHGHERFKAEIARAKESKVLFYVIVEESYLNIVNKRFNGAFNTKLKGYVLAKILHTIQVKYGIHFIFCNSREEARDYIRNTFSSIISNSGEIAEA